MKTSMPINTLNGISFKENLLYGYENNSSLYDENFLSSLNVTRCIIHTKKISTKTEIQETL